MGRIGELETNREPRTPEELLSSGLAIIADAIDHGKVWSLLPLFSGGHDSLCACYVASQSPRFNGEVYHINTGIGSNATRAYIASVAQAEGWTLRTYRSRGVNDSYERMVLGYNGFPGPVGHLRCYQKLKERSIDDMTRTQRRGKVLVPSGYVWGLITGCRSSESIQRMGHTVPWRVGDREGDTDHNVFVGSRRAWINPCIDWSAQEQRTFMEGFCLPRSPVKDRLGSSGECCCGCYARPGDREAIGRVIPDVLEEIERLERLARLWGCDNCVWGQLDKRRSQGIISVPPTGPLCTTCDERALRAGVIITQLGKERLKGKEK